MENLVGQTINKQYRVDESLGSGGMAEVYRVYDLKRHAPLAMKLLHDELSEDTIFLQHFRHEGKTLEDLQHPNIVRFYGMEKSGSRLFILMDYVDGITLREEIKLAHGIPFAAQRILEIMHPVCGALQYAHEQGFVHCDIKPANIMIEKRGRIVLADFGIAHQVERGSTTAFVAAGTPAYMAPELVNGQDPLPQSDIYALGILLYEMLTGGVRPFTGEMASIPGTTGAKVRWEQVNLQPPSLRRFNPNISHQLEAVVMRCLKKDPYQRYAEPFDLFAALQTNLGNVQHNPLPPVQNPDQNIKDKPGRNESSAQPVPEVRDPSGQRRKNSLVIVGMVGFVCLAILLLIASSNTGPRPTSTLEPKEAVTTSFIYIKSQTVNINSKVSMVLCNWSSQDTVTHVTVIRPDGTQDADLPSTVTDLFDCGGRKLPAWQFEMTPDPAGGEKPGLWTVKFEGNMTKTRQSIELNVTY